MLKRLIAAFERAAARAAERGNAEREQQCKSSAWQLRQEHGIPEPIQFGREATEPNRAAQAVEVERIKTWKRERGI